MLESGRRGPSLLVIEGEAGIGKTPTLWREAIARAQGFQVLSRRAAQAEARRSFAALTDLLAPAGAEAFAGLPPPQRAALEAALLRDVVFLELEAGSDAELRRVLEAAELPFDRVVAVVRR